MEKYILALDQGTTSSRAILFDAAGTVCGVEQQEFPQRYPEPGWVEHAPEDIWTSQTGVVSRLLRTRGVDAADIAALGITNQRETTILWERGNGRPVANAIVWQDRRTAPLCAELRTAGYDTLFQQRTGLTLDPYFSGTKIAWMLDHIPGLRARAEAGEIAFGTVDSFLMWRLSGGAIHATDVSNAARTLLYNIVDGRWDDEILSVLNIPRALLPEVCPSSHLYGETAPSLFGRSIPIAGVAGDQQAATFGQACHTPGAVKNTYGTGSFLLMNTGDTPRFSRHGLLTTIAWQLENRIDSQTTSKGIPIPKHQIPNTEYLNTEYLNTQPPEHPPVCYALEGSVFVTGAAVQWLRDELQIIRTAAEIEPLAQSVTDNGGVFFVPAFTGLGTPHWDPYARGAIFGLTRGTGRAHLARATLESVCYQTTDVVQAMQADSGISLHELRVDGGMTVNNTLLQMQADILGVPVVRPKVTETTALGAAYLAGLAVGFWQSPRQIAAQWAVDRVFEPEIGKDQREEMLMGWRRAVLRAREWATD
jgi:glycerol kinase